MKCLALSLLVLAACEPVDLITAAAEGAGGDPAAECITDGDCGFQQLCSEGTCHSCPDLANCVIPQTGAGVSLVTLVRNGCRLCEFAPPYDTCTDPLDCDTTGEICYLGARCAPGCNDYSCCANTCSAPGCDRPVQLGCVADCGQISCDGVCITLRCECRQNAWACDLTCVDNISPACTHTE